MNFGMQYRGKISEMQKTYNKLPERAVQGIRTVQGQFINEKNDRLDIPKGEKIEYVIE